MALPNFFPAKLSEGYAEVKPRWHRQRQCSAVLQGATCRAKAQRYGRNIVQPIAGHHLSINTVHLLGFRKCDRNWLACDPLTRPAPADKSASCVPPSPPRGRGLQNQITSPLA